MSGRTSPTSRISSCWTTTCSPRPSTSPSGLPRLGPAAPARCAPAPCSHRRRRPSRRPVSSRSTRYGSWSWTCIAGSRCRRHRRRTASADCDHRCCTTPRPWTNCHSQHRGPTPRPHSATSSPRPRRPGLAASSSTARWWPSRSAVEPVDGVTSSDSPSTRIASPGSRRADSSPTRCAGCAGAASQRVLVNTAIDNVAALALYRANGFRDQTDDLLILEHALDPSEAVRSPASQDR